ncbi:hypothetical protein [Streptomyces sp. NPDC050504]|uniref:hypothetical protein n=1 Tax=Streptomyces sp. NPDC050504 TaxID=3365618 RepID=UPI003798C0FE
MSETAGTGLPGPQTTLFEHALRLHRQTPDSPFHRSGEPLPDDERRRRGFRKQHLDHTRDDTAAARVLAEYFDDTSDPPVSPGELAVRLRGVPAPYCRNERIGAVVRRTPAAKVRKTGRWLVRYGTETGVVAIGLALLVEAGTARDIPRIQTIGLLSNPFGILAVEALARLPGGVEAQLWLAERVTGWGRVHMVHELCRQMGDHPAVRPWLLRRALDGDFLNSYFADRVARVTALHEVLDECGDDAEVVDQAGRVLHVMTYCEGMGESLRHYPHGVALLEAHVRHVARLEPTAERYFAAATVAHYLMTETLLWSEDRRLKVRWGAARAAYFELLDREDWCEAARAGLAAGDERLKWLADRVAPVLRLRAFRK